MGSPWSKAVKGGKSGKLMKAVAKKAKPRKASVLAAEKRYAAAEAKKAAAKRKAVPKLQGAKAKAKAKKPTMRGNGFQSLKKKR